jgi:serine/threonine protein kinase
MVELRKGHLFMNLFHAGQKDTNPAIDRYHITGLLGRGAFSDVFNCFDTSLNRIVAIKQLRQEYLRDDLKKKMFLNETKLISYLDHPGVVTLYDSFISKEGLPSYTMKLNKGYTLRKEITSKTRGQMLGIFIKLCETLAYAHDKGVIHLDLNPDNIMLGQYGEVVITDWGNAILFNDRPYMEYLKLIRDTPAPPFDITNNHFPENSGYLSPEQITDGKESLSPSTDIFSMGVILFEMITGRRPFEAESEGELHNKILNDQAPLLNEVQSDLPSMLSLICAKMLEKDPFHRYHSFHDVLIDMDRFQNSG